MNLGPRRNIKEMLPIHQNFIESHNFQQLFKSPVSTRQRQQRPSKLPSFKMSSGQQVPVPVSPPVSPQWRTRNMSRVEQRMLSVQSSLSIIDQDFIYKQQFMIQYYCNLY